MIYKYLHTWFWFDTLEAYMALHFWKVVGVTFTIGVLLGRD